MRALKPLELPGLFLRALNSGDVDAVVSLDEPDGVIAAGPNQVVAGHAAIRAPVAGFLTPRPRFELHDSEVVQSGDVALVRARWTVTQPGPAKTAGVMAIRPSLVARRQEASCCVKDSQACIALRRAACRACAVEGWADCLMPNRVHSIAVPDSADGFRRTIGEAPRWDLRRVNVSEGGAAIAGKATSPPGR